MSRKRARTQEENASISSIMPKRPKKKPVKRPFIADLCDQLVQLVIEDEESEKRTRRMHPRLSLYPLPIREHLLLMHSLMLVIRIDLDVESLTLEFSCIEVRIAH